MITVIHYGAGKDPDIYFGIVEKTEKAILRDLSKSHTVTRCSAEEWPGQDKPKYTIHHWDAVRKKGK